KGYRFGAWIGQTLLAIATISALLQGNWSNAIVLALFLVAAIAFMVKNDLLPTLFDLLFALAAVLNAGGWVWNWFDVIGPYDEIVHGFTIFALTLTLSFLVYRPLMPVFRCHTLLYLVTIASFGIAIGGLWEIGEWSAGKIFPTQVIGSVDDTATDLIMDTIGAVLAALLSLWVLPIWIDAHDDEGNVIRSD
ncbi:MAG: hypothetical protein LH474_00310, partial [Chamaesiphon sp.]|nr:hypothetical protein [Chamaesiphon sp.]